VEPEVTLTMAAWRVEPRWFREAVDSALAQEGCSFELLVVDDGSPEPVGELLADVNDPRLRVIRIEHGGTAAARNAGIDNARGRLIRFLDADDVLEPRSTARLVRLVGQDAAVAYGSTVVCDEDLRPLRAIESDLRGDAVRPCLLGRFDVRHVSMLFPRAVVDLAGPWVGGFHISEDWDFVLRALEHAEVRPDPHPATYYRRHGGSRTGAADIAVGEDDRTRVLDRFFERHPEQRGTELDRAARAAAYLDRAAAYAAVGETRVALRRLTRAARLAPVGTARTALRIAAHELSRRRAARNR
jgi:glycosyltransferase involved in cell wall biosynthesis